MNVSSISPNYVKTVRRNTTNPTFKARLQLHNEVTKEVASNALLSGKDEEKARDNFISILSDATKKINPIPPNVNVILGSTRRKPNDFMLYTPMPVPNAPKGLIEYTVIGAIDWDNHEEAVSKIVGASKELLFSIFPIYKKHNDDPTLPDDFPYFEEVLISRFKKH